MDIKITANAVDITNKILFPSLKIADNINSKVNQCNFSSNNFKVEVGDEIIVTDGATKIFAGVAVAVDVVVDTLRHNYKVTCKDYSVYLERKLVTERYVNQTVAYIIDDLLAEYATDFTDTNVVSPEAPISSISFNKITVNDCIQRLAELTNYSWYIDYDKDIHFFPKNTEIAPFNLSDGESNHIINSLSLTEDFSQLRNVIYVVGGETEAEERTELYVADGDQEQFPLAYKYAVIPAVTVDATPVTVGVDGVDDEASFDCFWSYAQKYIRFKTATKPAINDVVGITGIPLFSVLAKVPSLTSIADYGTYEYKIRDNNIKSRADAVARGRAELESYANPIKTGQFKTYRSGLVSGQSISLAVGEITGTYTIQTVKLTMRTPYDGEWTVDISSLSTIGIVTFLQKLLRDDEPIDETTTLLELLSFEDDYGMTDTLNSTFVETSPPYYYADANQNEARWNFSTWT